MAAKREHGFRMRLFSTASSRFVRDRALGFMCTRWFVLRHPPPPPSLPFFHPAMDDSKMHNQTLLFLFFLVSGLESLSLVSLSLSPSL